MNSAPIREVQCLLIMKSIINTILGTTGAWGNLSDCHVLRCKLHCNALDPSKKKLFKLHEIFKSLPTVAIKRPKSSGA